MKGRKPKYPQDVINDLAARQLAGESSSALSELTGLERTTIERFKDSVRLPAEIKSKALEAASQTGTVKQSEKLFRKLVDVLLRRGIELAPELTPKDVAIMVEAAVELRKILPSSRSARSQPEMQKDEETLMILRRQFKQPAANIIEVKSGEESSGGVLGGPKGVTLESASDGEPSGGPGQAGEANGAT